jgi:hypothetical protein
MPDRFPCGWYKGADVLPWPNAPPTAILLAIFSNVLNGGPWPSGFDPVDGGDDPVFGVVQALRYDAN